MARISPEEILRRMLPTEADKRAYFAELKHFILSHGKTLELKYWGFGKKRALNIRVK